MMACQVSSVFSQFEGDLLCEQLPIMRHEQHFPLATVLLVVGAAVVLVVVVVVVVVVAGVVDLVVVVGLTVVILTVCCWNLKGDVLVATEFSGQFSLVLSLVRGTFNSYKDDECSNRVWEQTLRIKCTVLN